MIQRAFTHARSGLHERAASRWDGKLPPPPRRLLLLPSSFHPGNPHFYVLLAPLQAAGYEFGWPKSVRYLFAVLQPPTTSPATLHCIATLTRPPSLTPAIGSPQASDAGSSFDLSLMSPECLLFGGGAAGFMAIGQMIATALLPALMLLPVSGICVLFNALGQRRQGRPMRVSNRGFVPSMLILMVRRTRAHALAHNYHGLGSRYADTHTLLNVLGPREVDTEKIDKHSHTHIEHTGDVPSDTVQAVLSALQLHRARARCKRRCSALPGLLTSFVVHLMTASVSALCEPPLIIEHLLGDRQFDAVLRRDPPRPRVHRR